ncbi:hypothetical protein F2Q68_00011447 [Brassica cretica]|uniref:Uncharacterized protein n=1 Tax=Brassica cretica TaxID=69181 RepID=A0A8S9KR61_BRACR|nr:hypothetical protein F2Q68_00011447 [Brassica cretica]
MVGIGYVSETSFVLQDLEGEHIEDYLRHHIEKLALKFQWPVLRPGITRDARELFDLMPERNVISWDAMLGGSVRASEWEEALNA